MPQLRFKLPTLRSSCINPLRRAGIGSQRIQLAVECLEDRLVPAGNASGMIEGVAFVDLNGNRAFDAGETVLAGGQVSLTGTTSLGAAVNAVVTSDADGTYQFDNVLPGSYQLNGEQVDGFSPLGATSPFVVGEGETVMKNVAYGGMSTELISMRMFLNSSLSSNFQPPPGSGTGEANFRGNNRPETLQALGDQTIGRNTSTFIDLAGFFTDPDFTNSIVRFRTSEGAIDVELFDTGAARTVANFFNYVLSDRYDEAIFHRLDPGFVIQGGGFTFQENPSRLEDVPADQPVQNEFGESNTFGTIAMAKLDGDPDSATNEFFFNLGNNSGNLDTQNGGFTVFGEIADANSTSTLNALAALPVEDQGGPFDEIPLIDYNGTNFPTDTTAANFALISDVEVVQRDEFLTYALVANDNPAVVTATIEQNRLIIDAVMDAVGEANLTIRATDRFGASLEVTFKVIVQN